MPLHIPASVYRASSQQELNEEQEKNKKQLYENMSPRRRKFIDRIGYENWDPFPVPNEPMELRVDVTGRSTQQLTHEFGKAMQNKQVIPGYETGQAFEQGALEMALHLVNRDEKYLGMFEFAIWYYQLLEKSGHIDESKKGIIS